MAATSNELTKLESFDQDIRFMGLNDLTQSFSLNRKTEADPQVVKAVVQCLADSSPDVVNQAVKLIGILSQSGQDATRVLVSDILSQKAPCAVRGVALKHIFQNKDVAPDVVDKVVASLTTDIVFETVEGVDALVELIKSSEVSGVASRLVEHLLDLLASTPPKIGVLLPVFDALAATIPQVSDDVWASRVQPSLQNKLNDALYIGLIARLCNNVPSSWLVPEISDKIVRLLDSPIETMDAGYVEAVLKTQAALVASYPLAYSKYLEDMVRTVQRTIAYREFDGEDDVPDADEDGATSDMDFDADFNSDDSEWFDESSGIRNAASQLASVVHDRRCFELVLNSLNSEQDEATRVTMYSTLATLYSALPSGSASFAEVCKRNILKDLAKQRLVAVDSAIRLVASVDGSCPADIIKAAMECDRLAPHKYVMFLNGDAHGELTCIKGILSTLLTDKRVVETPEDVLVHAVNLARNTTGDQDILNALLSLKSRTDSEAVRVACIETLPYLVDRNDEQSVNRGIDEELQTIRDKRSTEEVGAGLTALRVLVELAADKITPESMESIIQGLKPEITHGDHISAANACELLCSLPSSASEAAVTAISQISNPKLYSYAERFFTSSDSKLSQPIALNWAIEHQVLGLISRIARLPDRFESTLSECLTRSDSPDVHAAAASGKPKGWELLEHTYGFSKTPFAELNDKQLSLLLQLAQRQCAWTWYSLEDMEQAVNTDLQSQIYGTIAAVVSGDAAADAQRFESLREPLRAVAFTAYIRHLRDPSTVLDMMYKSPELQVPDAAAAAIPNHLMLEEFTRKFAGNPKFVIETIKLVDLPDVLEYSWPVLVEYVKSRELDSAIRADALATVRWTLQKTDPMAPAKLHDALELAASAIIPDTSLVQTVNIGPFKHKVDPSAILRLSALEVLYTCLIPNVESVPKPLLNNIVSHLVSYSLKDSEHDIRIMTFRLLTQLIRSSAGSEALRPLVPEIEQVIQEDLNRKLKDSAVKQDVEKQADLINVINELQREINRLSL